MTGSLRQPRASAAPFHCDPRGGENVLTAGEVGALLTEDEVGQGVRADYPERARNCSISERAFRYGSTSTLPISRACVPVIRERTTPMTNGRLTHPFFMSLAASMAPYVDFPASPGRCCASRSSVPEDAM